MEDQEDPTPPDMRSNSNGKNERDDKIVYYNYRKNCRLCCICHMAPAHSRCYYGHVFCTDCFYKYIFSPSKADCIGDVTNKEPKEDAVEIPTEYCG